MSKATRKIDEHTAQLARMRHICSQLDDVREESERLRRDITGEARRLSDAARTPEPAAEDPGVRSPRDRAN